MAAYLPPTYEDHIAVLDDDIRFIRMVERVLAIERIGTVPITTIDLDEAVRIVGEGGFSAVLVDIMMYGYAAGFDLIEKLRSTPATAALRLVVVSGARRELGRRIDFLRSHNCAVLLKPFEPDELIAKLRGAEIPAAVPAEPAHAEPIAAPVIPHAAEMPAT